MALGQVQGKGLLHCPHCQAVILLPGFPQPIDMRAASQQDGLFNRKCASQLARLRHNRQDTGPFHAVKAG